jgi:hypothetical protein
MGAESETEKLLSSPLELRHNEVEEKGREKTAKIT